MSPEQCRAARGWLRWSQQQLADRAKVSVSTLKDFENRARKPIPNNLAAIKGALEAAGIESVISADDAGGTRPHLWVGAGVRLLVRKADVEPAVEILGTRATTE